MASWRCSLARSLPARFLPVLLLGVWISHCEAERYRIEAEVGPTGSTVASPLHVAVEAGDVQSVIDLLAAGENADALDADHYSPLHLAAGLGHSTIARVLCQHGASVASVDEK